jgi:hypothetical protein
MPSTAQNQASAQSRNFPLARTAHLSLSLASLLFFSACQSQTSSPPVAKAPAALPAQAALQAEMDLHNRILAEIGGAACISHAQCRTVALGAKACGGPQAWLAWSTSVSREATLTALTEQLAQLQRQRHAQSGMASTCQFIADPGALCQAQRCVLRLPDTLQ